MRHLALALIALGLFGLSANAALGDDSMVSPVPSVTAAAGPAAVVPVRWYSTYYGPAVVGPYGYSTYYGPEYYWGRPYRYYYGPRWYPGYVYRPRFWYSGPFVQFGY